MPSVKTHLDDKLMVSLVTIHVSWNYNTTLTIPRWKVGLTTSPLLFLTCFWAQEGSERAFSWEVGHQGLTFSGWGSLWTQTSLFRVLQFLCLRHNVKIGLHILIHFLFGHPLMESRCNDQKQNCTWKKEFWCKQEDAVRVFWGSNTHQRVVVAISGLDLGV